MKKILHILLVPIIMAVSCKQESKAQMNDTTSNMNKAEANALFKKAEKQKHNAVGTLLTGAGISIIGLIVASSDHDSYTGALIVITGSTIMIGSIYHFIQSANSRKKANLLIKRESVFFDPQSNLKTHLVSLGVKINLTLLKK
jgi:hypothetical protein